MMRNILIAMSLTGMISCSNNRNVNEKQSSASSTISMLSSPAGDSCGEPYLSTDKDGIVYLSWIVKKGKQSTLKFSSFVNDKWSEPSSIATGNNWVVNWADYPVIAADGSNNFIAHFLEKNDPVKFTYDVKFILSADSGRLWSRSKLLNDDGVKAEHGFVSIIPYKDQFFVCWLDGRKTGGEEDHGGHEHHGEMSLRAAFIDKNGNKTNEWELDEKVCDCCQTTATITNDGPVVVYRDRSDDEIRDISIVRYVDGTWTSPKTIHDDNWQIKACPVNGPRADAIGNYLAIAWFTMKDKEGEVKVVFSNNGGGSFTNAIAINENKSIGRVDVSMIDSATAMVSWMEGSLIKATKVRTNGNKEPAVIVASSSEARSSGFPQMTKAGNKIFFAWTDEKTKSIKLGQMSL